MPVVSINGRNMHYDIVGTGEPIVFGHSFLFDGTSWNEQIKVLSQHYQCIVTDLWGHGQSDPISDDSYSIEQIADDFWEFTQALNLNSFSIVGLSVGGMWGTELTLQHPESVKSIVLMDTYVGSEEEPALGNYLSMLNVVEQTQSVPEPLIEKVIPMFFSKETLGVENHPLTEGLRSSLRSIDSKNANTIARIGRAIFKRRSLIEYLGDIKCPTLIMVGDEDMPRPVSESQDMANHIKDSQIEIISGAGHVSNMEKPNEVNQVLTSFFKNI